MANKSLVINNVTYNDVTKVKMPLASDPSQMAVYVETSDATASPNDIKKGTAAYVGGNKIDGELTLPNFILQEGTLSVS